MMELAVLIVTINVTAAASLAVLRSRAHTPLYIRQIPAREGEPQRTQT